MYICKQVEDFIMTGDYPEIIASRTIICSCASIKMIAYYMTEESAGGSLNMPTLFRE